MNIDVEALSETRSKVRKIVLYFDAQFLPNLFKHFVSLVFPLRRLLAARLSLSVVGQDEPGDPSDWNSMASLKISLSLSRYLTRVRSVCADTLALSRAVSMAVKALRSSADGLFKGKQGRPSSCDHD